MKAPVQVVQRPLISEKSYAAMATGKYLFKVHPRATKTDIAMAVADAFKVDVVSVNTMHVRGKERRRGRTHGSHNIKQPGSIGSSSTPSRVYKGMRMAGQLGNAQRTTIHLKVVRVDVDRNLLLVNGDVPGHKNSVVLVRDSVRQPKGAK